MESTTAEKPAPLSVDVVSDVVCPWCYIGKRRLEMALAALSEREPRLSSEVRWHAFQLNPELPQSGVDRRLYAERKFGSAARVREISARIDAVARSVGLSLALDRIARQPNTEGAHRLITWAQRVDSDNVGELVEALFHAFFSEGRDVGDHRELVAIATAAGYDTAGARALLDSDRFAADVKAANRRAAEIGIRGVPFFVFDGKVALSGAQEPQTLLEAIAKARE